MMENQEQQKSRMERMMELLQTPPSQDYDSEFNRAKELLGLFREDTIERIRGPLNAQMKAKHVGEYEAIKNLSKWANDQLRSLSLSFKTEDGAPAFLMAGLSGAGRGRYRLMGHVDGQWRQAKSFAEMIDLDITAAHQREADLPRGYGRGG